MKMKLLMSGLFFLASIKTLLVVALGVVDNSPGCTDSCSNQVNCTINYSNGFCGAGAISNLSQGPDIAAEPVDLKYNTLRDEKHQYVRLSWRPPEDGSYNYLTEFLVQVTVINLDPVQTGVTGTSCYRVQPAQDWFQIHRSLHRQGGVVFFMNCLRVPAQASMDLVISIHSLPLRPDAPKLAVAKIIIEPDAAYWNPRFDKWADPDDVMHLVIQNPLREARFYHVQIKSVEKDRMVFSHIFPAVPDNRTQDNLLLINKAGLPHFLITGLNKGDNYSILMDVLDANKTGLPHMRSIQTNPFKLNFTSLEALALARVTPGLDNRLIIVVAVSLVVVVAVFVCLVWKGVVRPSKMRTLVQNCAGKIHGVNRPRSVSFMPIYCYDSDNYKGAVDNHVSLLQRWLPTQFGHSNSDAGMSLCYSNTTNQASINSNNTDPSVIIYLSPRLGNILQFGRTCSPEFSGQDVECHKALLSLCERRQNGHRVEPLVVTFDCFEKAELMFLDDLSAFISSPQAGNHLCTPVKLASFGENGWKVENIDILYFRLNNVQESSPNIPLNLQGWRECEEVKAVERYLSLLAESLGKKTEEVARSWDQKRYSGSQNLERLHYSSSANCLQDELEKSFSDRLGKSQDDFELRRSHEDIKFLSNGPFVVNSRDFKVGSDSFTHDKFQNSVVVPNNYLKSSAISYNAVKLSPTGSTSRDHSNYQASHRYAPAEVLRYQPQDCNEKSDSILMKGRRTNIHLQGVATYKCNDYNKDIDTADSTSLNSTESDLLLRTNDLNGYVRRQDQFSNEVLDDTEWVIQKDGFRMAIPKDIIIPPSLNHSNFTSMESVCERINRVNEYSGWSQLNLSK